MWAGKVGLGSDLFVGRVSEQGGRVLDHPFIKRMPQVLVTILLCIVDVLVLDEWFHRACDRPVVDVHD